MCTYIKRVAVVSTVADCKFSGFFWAQNFAPLRFNLINSINFSFGLKFKNFGDLVGVSRRRD